MFIRWVSLFCFLVLVGCTNFRNDAVPENLVDLVSVSDIPDARFNNDSSISAFLKRHNKTSKFRSNSNEEPNYLFISGGGINVAFGAGVLSGWTQLGTRPSSFKIVTGTSAGALLAPFAFLGSDLDPTISNLVTQTPEREIFRKEIIGLFRGYFNNNQPLEEIIFTTFTAEIINRIARRYKNEGALLLIGTTNLDAKRHIVWNIGAIATAPIDMMLKRRLIARIITTSTSIPIIFDAKLIDVVSGNNTYRELHVDGGASENIFSKQISTVMTPKKENIYLLVNSRLNVPYDPVNFNFLSIGENSLATLLNHSLRDSIDNIILRSDSDSEVHIAFIPQSFSDEPLSLFDINYRQRVFSKFKKETISGNVWERIK